MSRMASEFESGGHVTAVESLPRPGAVQLHYLDWVPTLDGEPVDGHYRWHGYRRREDALAEAIKRVKHQAGLAFTVEIDTRSGCVLSGGIREIVESVAEARKVIVRHAGGGRSKSRHDEPDDHGHVRFKTRQGRSAWKSLLECETSRRYDPSDAEAGMTCSYLLYEHEGLGVVGGGTMPYSVEIWATAPPEVWDHPAGQPIGLDSDDDLHNDYPSESATNDPSELEGG